MAVVFLEFRLPPGSEDIVVVGCRLCFMIDDR